MKIYLAPLQGLTDWIFRESYSEHIGHFDKTFTPFVRMQSGEYYRPNQRNDLLPENNRFQQPVPQFLGNDFASFQRFEALCKEHNYTEANINLGCPFPMVTAKKLGAGLLAHPTQIDELLSAIFSETQLRISIKCRLGQENATEFESLIPIFNHYPLEEIIIHPRLGKQQYKGEVDFDAFARYVPKLNHPVCFNGDILKIDDIQKIRDKAPQVQSIMIGRGVLQNPFLLSEIRQEHLSEVHKRQVLMNFHQTLITLCKQKYAGDLHLLHRFTELWMYHAEAFEDGRKIYKQVKKCSTLAKYEALVLAALNKQI